MQFLLKIGNPFAKIANFLPFFPVTPKNLRYVVLNQLSEAEIRFHSPLSQPRFASEINQKSRIMKKMLLILVLVLICSQMAGQTKKSSCFLTNTTSIDQSKRSIKNLSLKSYLVARKEYKKSSNETFSPNFSVDLLDGKGIHLFTTPKIGPIPTVNVGARINAGIKITI